MKKHKMKNIFGEIPIKEVVTGIVAIELIKKIK